MLQRAFDEGPDRPIIGSRGVRHAFENARTVKLAQSCEMDSGCLRDVAMRQPDGVWEELRLLRQMGFHHGAKERPFASFQGDSVEKAGRLSSGPCHHPRMSLIQPGRTYLVV